MGIIKGLLLIILLFGLLFLESFFLRVFSFSVFIIVVISMKGRVKDFPFYTFLVIFSIILDSVMHTPLGAHLLVVAFVVILYDFFAVIIPQDSKFNYLSVFLLIFLYYVFLPIINSILQGGGFPNIFALPLLNFFIASVISVCIYAGINHFTKFVRNDRLADKIRLN